MDAAQVEAEAAALQQNTPPSLRARVSADVVASSISADRVSCTTGFSPAVVRVTSRPGRVIMEGFSHHENRGIARDRIQLITKSIASETRDGWARDGSRVVPAMRASLGRRTLLLPYPIVSRSLEKQPLRDRFVYSRSKLWTRDNPSEPVGSMKGFQKPCIGIHQPRRGAFLVVANPRE